MKSETEMYCRPSVCEMKIVLLHCAITENRLDSGKSAVNFSPGDFRVNSCACMLAFLQGGYLLHHGNKNMYTLNIKNIAPWLVS